MKVLCVIDHFGSGGAQRQMVNLASGLKANNHHVEMFVYHPVQDFFRSAIERDGIHVHEASKARGFSFRVLWRLMWVLRRGRYDAVISFLDAPNIYVELASIAAPQTKVIVSERSSGLAEKTRFMAFMRRVLHSLADAVVANSNSHAAWLARYSWLRRKVKTIYNGYSLGAEVATKDVQAPPLSLLAIGRVGPEKNGIRLIEALEIFRSRRGYVPQVSWVGKEDTRPAGKVYCKNIHAMLNQHPVVKANWNWLGERQDIHALLTKHRALIHPSLFEGLPNVVCEAFIAARPALVSNVCDHPVLVEDGRRGFLFDPLDPESIADAIERLAALSDEQWREFSANARRYAEEKLTLSRMVKAYEAIICSPTPVTPT